MALGAYYFEFAESAEEDELAFKWLNEASRTKLLAAGLLGLVYCLSCMNLTLSALLPRGKGR